MPRGTLLHLSTTSTPSGPTNQTPHNCYIHPVPPGRINPLAPAMSWMSVPLISTHGCLPETIVWAGLMFGRYATYPHSQRWCQRTKTVSAFIWVSWSSHWICTSLSSDGPHSHEGFWYHIKGINSLQLTIQWPCFTPELTKKQPEMPPSPTHHLSSDLVNFTDLI